MKTICFCALVVLFAVLPQPLHAQLTCGDSGGCSIVSYVESPNTIGIVQFGNTKGKIFLKKKLNICPGSSCGSSIVASTGLTAPSQTLFGKVRSSDVEPNQVLIGVQLLRITTDQVELLGIRLDDFFNNHQFLEPLNSKAKLNSGVPGLIGAGDNGFANVAPGPGNNTKLIHQLLENEQSNKLIQPIKIRNIDGRPPCLTVDRELSFVAVVEQTGNVTTRITFQEVGSNRKKSGPAASFEIPPTDSGSAFESIPSSASTPVLQNIPILGRLFAHKRIRQDQSGKDELAVFITPVIISGNLETSAQTITPGPSLQVTSFKSTQLGALEFFQTMAIDPQARFLIYTEYNSKCKKNVLKFASLDPAILINPVSASSEATTLKPKNLINCKQLKDSSSGVYGIDVLNTN